MRNYTLPRTFAKDMLKLSALLSVAAGGAAGSVLRYLVSKAAARYGVGHWGTLAVNVAGCLLIGIFMAMVAQGSLSDKQKALLVMGVCGGLTTFSTFSWDAIQLFQRSPAMAVGYILISMVSGLLAAWIGWQIMQ